MFARPLGRKRFTTDSGDIGQTESVDIHNNEPGIAARNDDNPYIFHGGGVQHSSVIYLRHELTDGNRVCPGLNSAHL